MLCDFRRSRATTRGGASPSAAVPEDRARRRNGPMRAVSNPSRRRDCGRRPVVDAWIGRAVRGHSVRRAASPWASARVASGISLWGDQPSGRRYARTRAVPLIGSTSSRGLPGVGDLSGAFSSSVATKRRYFHTCAAGAFRDTFLEKGYSCRGEGSTKLRRTRIAGPSLRKVPRGHDRSRKAAASRCRHRANGWAGNATSSKSASASSTPRPRVVISASTATSRVASSARPLPKRPRARSQSLRASSRRPR
jgi:hypothetical protein